MITPTRRNLRTRLRSRIPGVRFPDLYCWYVLASTLDILFTYIVIVVYKGSEANRIAAHIFDKGS